MTNILVQNCFKRNNSLSLFLCFPSFQEMLGELFTPIETPEAQNRGFLKGFFGGNSHNFDREELCALFCVLSFSLCKGFYSRPE